MNDSISLLLSYFIFLLYSLLYHCFLSSFSFFFFLLSFLIIISIVFLSSLLSLIFSLSSLSSLSSLFLSPLLSSLAFYLSSLIVTSLVPFLVFTSPCSPLNYRLSPCSSSLSYLLHLSPISHLSTRSSLPAFSALLSPFSPLPSLLVSLSLSLSSV